MKLHAHLLIGLCLLIGAHQAAAQVTFGPAASYNVKGPLVDSIVTADFNGDGKVDLISLDVDANTLSFLTNNGSGVFGSNATLNVGPTPVSIFAADVNGDGRLDLICANQNPTQVAGQWVYSLSVLTNNGNGDFMLASTIPTESQYIDPYAATAADVNGDGKMDLIYADQQHAKVVVLINASIYPTPPNLGITTYSNQPAVFFPTASEADFVLQMTTNLVSGSWVTISNGIPIKGLIITNPPANAFFRLR